MKRLSVLLVALSFAAVLHAEDKKKPAGDKKSGAEVGEWVVDWAPKDGNSLPGTKKAFKDIMSFKDGKLESTITKRSDFDSPEYKVTEAGGKTEITATQKSDQHGYAKWKITIADGKLTGTLVWEKLASGATFDLSGKKK